MATIVNVAKLSRLSKKKTTLLDVYLDDKLGERCSWFPQHTMCSLFTLPCSVVMGHVPTKRSFTYADI